jgi:hypothetical protein
MFLFPYFDFPALVDIREKTNYRIIQFDNSLNYGFKKRNRSQVPGSGFIGSRFSENFYPLLSKMGGFVPRLIKKTTTKVR